MTVKAAGFTPSSRSDFSLPRDESENVCSEIRHSFSLCCPEFVPNVLFVIPKPLHLSRYELSGGVYPLMHCQVQETKSKNACVQVEAHFTQDAEADLHPNFACNFFLC